MTVTAPAERALEPNDLVEIGMLEYGDEQYRLTVGRDMELVDQIIAASREPEIERKVPKDVQKRFPDRAAFESWYEKGRFLVALRDTEGDLAGIVWFGPSELGEEMDELHQASQEHDIPLDLRIATPDGKSPEGCGDTIDIRIYDKHRHKARPETEDASFARRLMNKAQFLYESTRQGVGSPVDRIWLSTNLYEPNTGERERGINSAVHLYQNAGYTHVATYTNPDPTNKEQRVIMVTEPYATRAIGDFALQAG